MALVSSTQGPTGTLMRMWVVHPKWVSQELHAGTTFHVVMLVGVTPQLAHRQERGATPAQSKLHPDHLVEKKRHLLGLNECDFLEGLSELEGLGTAEGSPRFPQTREVWLVPS